MSHGFFKNPTNLLLFASAALAVWMLASGTRGTEHAKEPQATAEEIYSAATRAGNIDADRCRAAMIRATGAQRSKRENWDDLRHPLAPLERGDAFTRARLARLESLVRQCEDLTESERLARAAAKTQLAAVNALQAAGKAAPAGPVSLPAKSETPEDPSSRARLGRDRPGDRGRTGADQ